MKFVVVALVCALVAVAVVLVEAQYCCDGRAPTGPCVNDLCPSAYMCTNGMCCTCRDTCYNCYLYTAKCNISAYASCMSCCQYTCGVCH